MKTGNATLDKLMEQVGQARSLTDQLGSLMDTNNQFIEEAMKNMTPEQRAEMNVVKAEMQRAAALAAKGDMSFVHVINNAKEKVRNCLLYTSDAADE